MDADRAAANARLNIRNATKEIRADLIHLIDEDDTRNIVFIRLTPNGLSLRLYTLIAVEHANSAVKDAERALNFDGEVDVAWRINDIETLTIPESRRCGRSDGDAALLLLLHPIHRRRAFMHFADFMALAGIIEDTFRRRRFTGVNMRHNAEVTVVLDRMGAGHTKCPR